MSETTDSTAHEAYAFACMRCGHGWEQAYEIEHHVDVSGRAFVIYKAEGARVPSPLSTPTCLNCGGHVVRIMRSGRVSSVQQLMHAGERVTRETDRPHKQKRVTRHAAPADEAAAPSAAGTAAAPLTGATPAGEPHHWHLSDLLHPFHRK
ncbi:hypothetical protein [Streptomyces sp. NBC_00344]|uniref:hypothetical protein n=1 Tax=Streptomyces sp. NBC_00344 TaxID=2975720 RepID=UPI002E1CE46D